jgi:hypothetical protein
MVRTRTVSVALSVALLGLTGCGGSDAPPPAATPAAPAATAPAASGTTAVATQGSTGSGGGLGGDIALERKQARKALRKWGARATRVCRKAERTYAPHAARIAAIGRQGKNASLAEAGRVFGAYAKAAEREYNLVRAIPLPAQPEAVDAIDGFFQKEEEALMLLQRAALELRAHNDRPSFVRTAARFGDLLDDYRRSARSVHAEACYD